MTKEGTITIVSLQEKNHRNSFLWLLFVFLIIGIWSLVTLAFRASVVTLVTEEVIIDGSLVT